jgi:hypothetical protein
MYWPAGRADDCSSNDVLGVLILLSGLLLCAKLTVVPSGMCSKRAHVTKFILDNVVGCALWQAAMISIDREYRSGAARLFHLEGAQ